MLECEIYLIVNEDGDYGVGPDYSQASENYEQDLANKPVRVIKLVVKVPNIVSEVKASVPAFKDAEILTQDVEKPCR